MIELQQLRCFLAVAEDEHVTHAAARLHVAQPAVNQQIQALERRLGTQLFDRVGRRVRLTAAGRALRPHAQAALAAAEAGMAEVRAVGGAVRGTLALGLVHTAGALRVAELVAEYHLRFPQVELKIEQEDSPTMLAAVRDGALDVAFVGLQGGHKPAGVVARWLLTDQLVVLVSPGHRFASRRRLRLAELRDEPLATLTHDTGSLVEQACVDAGFEPRIICQASGLRTLLDLCVAGLAVALAPASIATSIAASLPVLTLEAPVLQRQLALVSRPSGSGGPCARAFLSLANAFYDGATEDAGPRSSKLLIDLR
jgi:DNA-binding transcriptional LysR family regulator